MGKFEDIVQYMKVTLVYVYQFAHNKVSLASKLPRGPRPMFGIPCFLSKIKSMAKQPLSHQSFENTIAIWYLDDN